MSEKHYEMVEVKYNNKKSTEPYSLKTKDNNFYVEYLSGELAGRKKIIEVTQKDFLLLKNRKIHINELIIKYSES